MYPMAYRKRSSSCCQCFRNSTFGGFNSICSLRKVVFSGVSTSLTAEAPPQSKVVYRLDLNEKNANSPRAFCGHSHSILSLPLVCISRGRE